MSLDAMKQALAALENPWAAGAEGVADAIIALRAAIEQAQEPIGHADLGMSNIYIFSALEPRKIPVGRTPLYTAPRQWQGLTDDEIAEAGHLNVEGERMLPYSFARAIEAKLKERNT